MYAKAQTDDLADRIMKTQEQLEHGTVRAQAGGVVNLSKELTPGDIVGAGTAVATIVPKWRVELMIYTVTFSPSLDYTIELKSLEVGSVNRTTRTTIFPGGKGINV